jgi:putative aldouronate transport system substrate-binding protein
MAIKAARLASAGMDIVSHCFNHGGIFLAGGSIMKKAWAVIAVLAFIASSLAACSGAGNTAGGAVTIHSMILDRGEAAPGTTMQSNAMTEYIHQKAMEDFGIDVEFTSISADMHDEKLIVLIASSSAPDIMWTNSRQLFTEVAKRNGLADLGPSIEKYGSDIVANNGDILPLGMFNGVQYAVPAKRTFPSLAHLGYIRKDWLAVLGLPVPKTKEELISDLYAFRDRDPGGLGKDVIPWGMSGTMNSELHYEHFTYAYAETDDRMNDYLYTQMYKCLRPGSKEGFREMNRLYNDGVISRDFALDTSGDKLNSDIVNGRVGFFMADTFAPFDLFVSLKAKAPAAEFVPVNCLESPNGQYLTNAESVNGAYLMVPRTSEKKADACVKYLNWLAKPENQYNVQFSPEYTLNERNYPTAPRTEDLVKEGYPADYSRYSLVSTYFETNREDWALNMAGVYPQLGSGFFSDVFDTSTSDLYFEPVITDYLPTENKYLMNLQKMMLEFAYTNISAPAADFDKVYDDGYRKLEQAGLNEILAEKEQYYNEKVKK